ADRYVAVRHQVVAQVASATREVEHACTADQPERVDRATAPASIESQRDDAVHAVVARRQTIEHALDCVVLGVALGERAVAAEHGCVHDDSQPGSPRAAASSFGSPTA